MLKNSSTASPSPIWQAHLPLTHVIGTWHILRLHCRREKLKLMERLYFPQLCII